MNLAREILMGISLGVVASCIYVIVTEARSGNIVNCLVAAIMGAISYLLFYILKEGTNEPTLYSRG